MIVSSFKALTMAENKYGFMHLAMTVFILAAVSTSAQQTDNRSMSPVHMLPPGPFVTTEIAPTTQNTTATVTTTPIPHNTTTANSTATTPLHNTTTANSTATTPLHSSTTAKVTATTTIHSTTTVKTTPAPLTPTPATNSTEGTYTLKNGNKACVMVKAAIQIHVNNSKTAGTYTVQPNNTDVKGQCFSNNASLKIVLKEGSITMNFTKNDTTHTVYVSGLTVVLTYAFKSGVESNLDQVNKSQLFSMAVSHSYSCKSESVFMGDGVYLQLEPTNLQAFNFSNNNQFGPIDRCKADQPNYSVAIGIGVTLLILIIIVIVAYLISRKKRTDGYQSF